MGGRLLDYIAQGDSLMRPLASSMPAKIAAGGTSFYYSTDTQVLSVFDSLTDAWKDFTASGGGGGGGGSTISWTNGSGNKRLFMTATAVNGVNSPNAALAAVPSSTFYFSGASGCSITFDFLIANVVQAIAFMFDLVAGNQGNWTVEASNDNATWSTLLASQAYTPISTNGLANVIFNFASNSTAYRYYRVRQLSGSSSSSAYVNQFLFKCEPLG